MKIENINKVLEIKNKLDQIERKIVMLKNHKGNIKCELKPSNGTSFFNGEVEILDEQVINYLYTYKMNAYIKYRNQLLNEIEGL